MHDFCYFWRVKRAIIVGLNYPGTEYQLEGCVKDAQALDARMKAAKVHTEVYTESITPGELFDILADAAASQKKNDVFYLTFSGHGTQWFSNKSKEQDLQEEGICLWDRPNGIMVIRDDDLRKALQRIPGTVIVIFDSCFSGGMDRVIYEPITNPRKFVPFNEKWKIYEPAIDRSVPSPFSHRSYYLLACDESQVSYDTTGGGLFTVALCRAYDKGANRVGALMRETAKLCMPEQTPVLKIEGGNISKKVF